MNYTDIMNLVSNSAVILASLVAIVGVETWKREARRKKRSELAERALLCVYEMEGAIAAIRSPFSTSTEYADRKASQYGSESEKSARDRAYVIFSRLQKYNDLYTEMRSVRQRCRVVFDDSYTGLFDDLWSIIIKIRFSAEMLGDHYWTEPMGHCEDERRKEMSAERQKYEQVIWSWGSSDEVEPKVKKIVAEAERLFREKITPSTIGQRICNA